MLPDGLPNGEGRRVQVFIARKEALLRAAHFIR
jgi:hypothetical protein